MNKIITLSLCLLSLVSFSQYSKHYTYEQALAADNVRSVAIDNNGEIWIGTISGITNYNGTTFTTYTTEDGLGSNLIYDIYIDNSNNVWAATGYGLAVYDGVVWNNYIMDDGMPSNTIWTVSGDENDVIWFGTSDTGIGKIDGGVISAYGTGDGLISNSVKRILVDRSGNVWSGTASGISMFTGSEWINFNQAQGLGGNLINEIIQLKNGNICVGSNGGLSVYNYYEWTNYTTADGLPNNNILSIAEDNNQKLLIGTSQGLIEFENFTNVTIYDYDTGLADNIVNVLVIDDFGAVWAGSPFTGITYFDRNNTCIIFRDNKDLLNDEVNVLLNDNNALWVGSNGGLNRVEGLHWRSWSENDGIASDTVTAIFVDENNKTWVGTKYGLSIIDGLDIENFTVADGLTNDNITGITGDEAGTVYVATAEKMTVFENYAVVDTICIEDGLSSDTIVNTLYDVSDGRLWILCDTAVQFIEDDVVYQTNEIPACEFENSIAIEKAATGVYVGSDNYLINFTDGNNAPDCFEHAHAPAINNITSISQSYLGLLTSYDDGSVYYHNTIWEELELMLEVSCIEALTYKYIGFGLETDGLLLYFHDPIAGITADVTDVYCLGDDNGEIDILSPTGAGWEYSIDNGETWSATTNFPNLYSGYYKIMARNASDYAVDTTVYISTIDDVEAKLTITQITCNGDNNGIIELTDYQSGDFVWNDGNFTDDVLENLTPSYYQVTVTSFSSCALVLRNEIIEPDALSIIEDHDDVLCYGQNTGRVEIEIQGGTLPYIIEWNTGDELPIIEEVEAGTYEYTVTDAKGCSENGAIIVQQPAEPLAITGVADEVDCYGDLGCIDIDITGGTPDYEILWSTTSSEEYICNLEAGEYFVTVVDAHGCSLEESFEIIQPASALQISDEDVVNVYCNGDATGEIVVTVEGGTPDYSFTWNLDGDFYSNEPIIDELSAGTYTLTVEDANSCSITESYTIIQPDPLSLSIDVTPITCPGHDDAILYADVEGGTGIYSSFYWYNQDDVVVGVEQTFENVAPGEYTVSVTDSYYCTITGEVVVEEAVGSNVEAVVTDANCFGGATGSIQILIDGGTPSGATYLWQDGVAGNEALAENITAGEYTVTVTDPNGCVNEFAETIEQPDMQDLGAFPDSGELRFCSGDDITLNAGPGYEDYSWSTGDVGQQTITVAYEDTYTVQAVDAQGCIFGDTVQVIIGEVFQDEELGLVSVNELNQPVLYWSKTEGVGTDYYNVYREGETEFELIGSKQFDETTIFTDTEVDASETPYRYSITAIDTCGNESDYSDMHRSIYLMVQTDQYGVCTLDWTPYEGFFVVYYFVYSGDSEENLSLVDSTLYNNQHYVEMNPHENGTYYQIVVRRLDPIDPGNEISYTKAYSNIVFCNNDVGIKNSFVNDFNVYPLPFDTRFKVELDIAQNGQLLMSVYNSLGQKVADLDNCQVNTGYFSKEYKIDLPSGIYILKCIIGNEEKNIRLIRQ
ncbi:MAG: two-component regulator propeller domain-containing protein [Bacteroidales bacterium]|nr:two-component regulator propeller domain-containing protein [Bacteroidales bacterium]